MTETNHQYKRTGKAPARAQQQQGPPCLTSRHRHTLSRAGRRAYGDGETTAGLEHAGASINKHDPQSTGTRKQATTQSATRMQHNRWKPFSLDKLLQERSHPPGALPLARTGKRCCHSDGAAGLISASASLALIGRFCLAARCRGGALPSCQPLPAEHRGKLAARACSSDGCGERLRMVSQIRGREVCWLTAPGDQSLE